MAVAYLKEIFEVYFQVQRNTFDILRYGGL